MAKTLFILDEASQLGNMKELRNAVTLLRGYEVSTWWFFQDVSQVKECFPEPSELWNNVDVQTFHGTNSLESAEPLSKRLGEATIQVLSHQEGTSWSQPTNAPFEQPQGGSLSTSRNVTRSEVARHLLKPEEVLQLPGDRFLGFVRGVPPICGTLVRYFNAPEFKRNRGGRPEPVGLWAGIQASAFLLAAAIYATGITSFALGWHERPPETLTPEAVARSIRAEVIGRYRQPPYPASHPHQEDALGSARQTNR